MLNSNFTAFLAARDIKIKVRSSPGRTISVATVAGHFPGGRKALFERTLGTQQAVQRSKSTPQRVFSLTSIFSDVSH